MSVVLLILKILGWILLALLLLLLVLLLVPVRYRGFLSYREKVLNGDVTVSWMLHLVEFLMHFREGGTEKEIRVFGLALGKKKEKGEKTGGGTEKAPEEGKAGEEEAPEKSELGLEKAAENGPEIASENGPESRSESGPEIAPENGPESRSESGPEKAAATTGKATVNTGIDSVTTGKAAVNTGKDSVTTGKAAEPTEKAGDSQGKDVVYNGKTSATTGKAAEGGESPDAGTGQGDNREDGENPGTETGEDAPADDVDAPEGLYGRFLEKLGAFREKYRELRRKALFVTDERTGEAISYALLQVRKLVRHIAPKRVEGELHFGFDSPADTGMVYAYLCRLYPAAEDFYLDPDFTEACLDGEAALEGRVYAGYIVLVGLRLLLKKEVRFVLKNYKKYFGKEKGAPENGKPAAAEA